MGAFPVLGVSGPYELNGLTDCMELLGWMEMVGWMGLVRWMGWMGFIDG
jgi:hypothetical protein